MISKKIDGAIVAISDLAGKISPKEWAILSCVQRELRDASKQASHLEKSVTMAGLKGVN